MFYSDDPVKDFERYDRYQCRMLKNLPVCSCCGRPIFDEVSVVVDDEVICGKCRNDEE